MSTRVSLLGVWCAVWLAGQAWAETTSFQNGTNGYMGTSEVLINDDVKTLNRAGSSAQNYFLDGDQSNGSEINYWDLIKFDGLFGLQGGQIPQRATILSARLELTTSTVSNAQSGGPWGVARLLRPMDDSSTWTTAFGEDGIPDDTDMDRPASGYRALTVGTTSSADVTSIVQAWADGADNNGFLVMAGTSDGWSIQTIGNSDPALRPRLVVEYVPTRSRAIVIQQGLNEYAGTSMIFLRMDGTSTPGTDHFHDYLDLRGAAPDTTNTVHALLKFDAMFGDTLDQVPPAAEILKAYVVVTTAPRSESFETRSNGPYNIRPLLGDVNWALADDAPGFRFWSDFGADGPIGSEAVGPIASSCQGMVWDSQAWFDITELAKAWQTGATNYGLILEAASTDGWKINWLGEAAIAPMVVVRVASHSADLNGDTYVDDVDLDLFSACFSGPAVAYTPECSKADLDNDGDADQADFAAIQRCFSGSERAAAPECW